MLKQHETPLVIRSNRGGADFGIGTISPVFLPLHVELAGISHPYYTGFLGTVRDRYKVVDRHMLLSSDDQAMEDWAGNPHIDTLIGNFRLLQYDMMFGGRARYG
jgi:phosphoglycerol transferase MdoB-like AlkP superfamily enzyme